MDQIIIINVNTCAQQWHR